MDKVKIKNNKQARRHGRVRVKVFGTKERPRLSVFRSNKSLFLQLIDDTKGITLVSAASKEVKKMNNKIDQAKALGNLLATKAKTKKISTIVFDRGHYSYHGRVKAVAEGAREGGLKF